MVRPSFSAVLLAGGQSRRMGRDKALLPVAGYDFLWQRQLAILDELKPAKIYWSGAARDGLPDRVITVADVVADAGPLAGICACLERCETDLLVVLAIDLPRMTATFLERLLHISESKSGVVARRDYFEPLAAVYPKATSRLARAHLQAGRLALQDFVSAGASAGLLRILALAPEDEPLFLNVNAPTDLSPPSGASDQAPPG